MFNNEPEEIPVYVFMGFLGSGKTTFAKDVLLNQGFTEGAKTLLLACEDGEEEYDEKVLKEKNIYLEYIDESTLTAEHLLELGKKYDPENVMIEYNGMWELDRIFQIRVPKGWTVVQVISFVDATTFDVYVNNMKKIMMDQLRNADMIIFNRCDENTKTAEYRRSLKILLYLRKRTSASSISMLLIILTNTLARISSSRPRHIDHPITEIQNSFRDVLP